MSAELLRLEKIIHGDMVHLPKVVDDDFVTFGKVEQNFGFEAVGFSAKVFLEHGNISVVVELSLDNTHESGALVASQLGRLEK